MGLIIGLIIVVILFSKLACASQEAQVQGGKSGARFTGI